MRDQNQESCGSPEVQMLHTFKHLGFCHQILEAFQLSNKGGYYLELLP